MSTWVLLRGLMRESRHWGEFPRQLHSAMGMQAVVTLDFPGNGSLHMQTSARSVAGMAEHCRTQLRQLGYHPPYRVLALSLGAMAAVEWSRCHPAEIDRLVLINTSLAPYSPFYHRLRPANYPALLHFLIHGSPVWRERLILQLTSRLERSAHQQDELLRQWVSYAQEFPVSRGNVLRQLRAAISYQASLTPPQVPLLLLASQRDRLVDVRCSSALAQHWGCPLRLHTEAGHDLPLDDGTWVVRQITEWIARDAGDANEGKSLGDASAPR
ncbi:2-succinyl-6-hydroxy-2,4-cyclohexadiene-1-carboxylate synthase [Sideroxyarcus emersonii]|uniref:2-succinyl-6-hydroxy-2, 4-cyclohexadiene-1-carboxylate synthase n=1 Tax=Sideroxyarcus emersonii TaxID=2764705 RepID=A0AAN1XAP1_9PROT|nr:alpha/beta hydrolase [Sideroxyarcus emersonii]BCK88001.1 2-succinyl-6-hydroxy-2,4-cyclohexadiene-1-carboxylate synthase [Sideroxyarcus emersonii]